MPNERKFVYPCNVAVKRFYRCYVVLDEGATEEEVKKAMTEEIMNWQEKCLNHDPDMEIEEDDVLDIKVDFDAMFLED